MVGRKNEREKRERGMHTRTHIQIVSKQTKTDSLRETGC